MELFESSPFIYITLLLYIVLMYSSSNRFDILLLPQILYDILALCRHLNAHSCLVPHRPRSCTLLILHCTCLHLPFRHQHLISPISYLALPPEPWGWFDPLTHIMSYGCPESCLLDLFGSRSWKCCICVTILYGTGRHGFNHIQWAVIVRLRLYSFVSLMHQQCCWWHPID
jgi:hypothetical protein